MKPLYGALALLLAGCSPSTNGAPAPDAVMPVAGEKETSAPSAAPGSAAPTPPPAPLSPDEQKRGALTKEEYDYGMALTNAYEAAVPVLDTIRSPESLKAALDSIQALQDEVDAMPAEPRVLSGARADVTSGLSSIKSAISSYSTATTVPKNSSLQDSFMQFAKLDLDQAADSFNRARDIIADGIGGKSKTR